jgi:deoxyribonuclease-4
MGRTRTRRRKRSSAVLPESDNQITSPTKQPAIPTIKKPITDKKQISDAKKPRARRTQQGVVEKPAVQKTKPKAEKEKKTGPSKSIALVAKEPATPHLIAPKNLLLASTSPSSPSLRKDQPLLLPLGRNMPANMTLLDAIRQAQDLGYSAIQLFISNPDSWHAPLLPPAFVNTVAHALDKTHFSSVLIHAPFVINLASEKEREWINSVLLLRTILLQAPLIGANAVVVHLNNYRKVFTPISQERMMRVVKGITYSLSDSPGIPFPSTRLLLENGCNPRFFPGSNIQELGDILHALPQAYQRHVGICLDTAHCWSAGYDLCDLEIVNRLLHTIDETIGLAHVQVIHLNDALYEIGSTRDQHAQWGTGQISERGVSGIQLLLQDTRLAHITLIMETPLLRNENKQPNWEQEKQHLARVKSMLLTSA